MKFLLKSLFLLVFVNLFSSQQDYSNSVVKILVTQQKYSYEVPWQAPVQSSCAGSGFLIDDEYIITNAHVVADGTTIHVQKNNESFPYEASIEYVDHDCDLAALRVLDKSFYDEMQALKFVEEVIIGEKLRVVGFPMAGINLCLTEGITSREERHQYSHSGKVFDVIQIDSSVNPGNSGGPAISQNDEKVIGVVHQAYRKGQNINHIIPVRMVKHFMKELKNQSYLGFPEVGVNVQPLLNPSLQKYYGLKDQKKGVLIQSIDFGSCVEGLLFPDDVLIAVDGYEIRSDGSIKKDGKVKNLGSFLNDKFYLDKVNCLVLRDKKEIPVEIKLVKSELLEQPLVPWTQYDCKPTYFVLGGFVFQPLSANFLVSCNYAKSLISFSSLSHYFYNGKKTEDRTEVIFINQILNDPINFGYSYLKWQIVSEINGQKVKNMKDFVAIVENTQDPFYVIITEEGEKLIIDREKVKESKENILKKYGLISDRSDDLKDISN